MPANEEAAKFMDSLEEAGFRKLVELKSVQNLLRSLKEDLEKVTFQSYKTIYEEKYELDLRNFDKETFEIDKETFEIDKETFEIFMLKLP